MHSEKHNDVSRRVVVVFKIVVSGIGGGDCFKLYTVLQIIYQRIRRPFFLEIDVNLGTAKKNLHVKMTIPYTNGVSAEQGTSRLRHHWHRAHLHVLSMNPKKGKWDLEGK